MIAWRTERDGTTIAESKALVDDPPANITGAPAAIEIVDWLAGDECHDLDDAGLAAGLGRRLRAAGVPVDRLTLHLRALHPEILGRSMAWAPEETVEVHNRGYDFEFSSGLTRSPLRTVMETRRPLTLRLDSAAEPAWNGAELFRGRRLVEFIFVPLCNSEGPVSAAGFATTQPDGFSASEQVTLHRIVPALRNACELRTLRRVERTLLATYVGATTARRVMDGRIRRGDLETLQAGLMICDLRGFTAMSNRLPAARVIELLNAYFDCVVPAIDQTGGEVIKFMGDAVLAFFHGDSPEASCSAALRGTLAALDNLSRFWASDAELHTGVALHYGEVGYGNIGSGERLDFTVIGPDVNLVSRIQSVCSATGSAILMSERFAGMLEQESIVAAGRYQLAGFAQPVELYALAAPIPGALPIAFGQATGR